MNNRAVMLTLGYAGLLPFYGFLAAAWSLEDRPAAISGQGFIIYSLGILCFLAGTLWGRVQSFDAPHRARLLVSNGLVLFAVAAVLTAQAWVASLALKPRYDAQKSDAGRSVGSRLIFYRTVGSDGVLSLQSLWCIRIGQPLIRHRDRPCIE